MKSRTQALTALLQAVAEGRVTPERAVELAGADDPLSALQTTARPPGETLLALDPDEPTNQPAAQPATAATRLVAPQPAQAKTPATRYEIRREFARGGMGRVLLAMDTMVGREIAIKELLPARAGSGRQPSTSALSTQAGIDRFLREARITGQLEHPNIVPVYEISTRDDGSVFYSMKFVRGDTLADRIKAIQAGTGDARAKLRERLRLLDAFAQVCQAVAFAHSRGVIHRDLKPGNIMLGEFGEVLVLDWGLAKVQGSAESGRLPATSAGATGTAIQDTSSVQTLDGQIMGTPAYMAPEQARAQAELVDEQSDIYALGAMLYELVTGRPPFEGNARQIVSQLQQNARPPEPQTLQPDAPPELCALVDRAMAPDRAARLRSAQDLAQEVKAFRDGRALSVYQYSSRELLARFVARNRAAVIVAATLLLALAAAGAWFWASIVAEQANTASQRDRALAASELADKNEKQARDYADQSERNAKSAQASASEARRQAENAQTERGKAETALAQAEVSLGHAYAEAATTALARMRLNDAALLAAQSLVHADNPRARAILVQARPVPLQASFALGVGGSCIAFSPCGRWIAAGTEDGQVVCIDRATGAQAWRKTVTRKGPETTIQALHWGMGGLYVLDRQGTLTVLDPEGEVTRRELRTIGQPFTMAVGPDESRVVLSGRDGTVTPLGGLPWQQGAGTAAAVAVHPLGETLAITSGPTVKLVDAASGKVSRELQGGSAAFTRVLFARQGTQVIASDNTGRLWLWWTDGQAVLDFQASNEVIGAIDWCERLGLIACIGPENTVRIYEETGRIVAELTGFDNWVTGVAFDPTGHALAATSRDGQVRVHDLGAGVGNWRPRVDHEVLDLGWDDSGLFVALRDLTIADFDRDALRPTRILRGLQSNPGGLVIGPDGAPRCFETGGVVLQWAPRGGDVVVKGKYICGHEAGPAAWRRDRGLAILTDEGRLVLVEGDKPRVLEATDAAFWTLATSPEGAMAAGVATDGRLFVWELESGKRRDWQAHQGAGMGVAFGQGQVFSTGRGEIKSWDPQTGNLLAERKLGPVTPFCVALSPRGDVLAVADETGALLLLSPVDLTPLAELRPVQDFVTSLQFSRDGKRIALAAINRQVVVLELDRLLATPRSVLADVQTSTGLQARDFGIGPAAPWASKLAVSSFGPGARETLAACGGTAQAWWQAKGQDAARHQLNIAESERLLRRCLAAPEAGALIAELWGRVKDDASLPRDLRVQAAVLQAGIEDPASTLRCLQSLLNQQDDPCHDAYCWNRGAALFQQALLMTDESRADEKLTLFVHATGSGGFVPSAKQWQEVAATATAGAVGHRSYDKLATAIGFLERALAAGATAQTILADERFQKLRLHRRWADLMHDLGCGQDGMPVLVVATGPGLIDVLWTANGRYVADENDLREVAQEHGRAILTIRRYRQAAGGGMDLARDEWGLPRRSITGRKQWKYEEVEQEVTPDTLPNLTPALMPQPD